MCNIGDSSTLPKTVWLYCVLGRRRNPGEPKQRLGSCRVETSAARGMQAVTVTTIAISGSRIETTWRNIRIASLAVWKPNFERCLQESSVKANGRVVCWAFCVLAAHTLETVRMMIVKVGII